MRKYFSGNYVFPSPKSSEDQKKSSPKNPQKRSSPKIEEFLSPKSSEDHIKKNKKGLHRNLGLNSAGICEIYSCCQTVFGLFNQRSNLDGGDASALQFKYWL